MSQAHYVTKFMGRDGLPVPIGSSIPTSEESNPTILGIRDHRRAVFLIQEPELDAVRLGELEDLFVRDEIPVVGPSLNVEPDPSWKPIGEVVLRSYRSRCPLEFRSRPQTGPTAEKENQKCPHDLHIAGLPFYCQDNFTKPYARELYSLAPRKRTEPLYEKY